MAPFSAVLQRRAIRQRQRAVVRADICERKCAFCGDEAVGARVGNGWTSLGRRLLVRIIEFRTLPVRGRVHAELLRLARIDAPHLGHCIATIAPAPTHATIASRIDTHREAVTREFNELARVGLIERKGRAIIVRDVAALAELVHGELEHEGLLH